MTASLTDFILARIEEREAAARGATGPEWRAFSMDGVEWTVLAANAYVARGLDEPTARLIASNDPTRVLARCAAERAIVDGWHPLGDNDDYIGGMEHARQEFMEHLAAAYSDHPDYREDWP